MRLSDAPSTQATIEIEAPPEAVWSIVTDLSTAAATSTEFRGAQWLDGATGPAVGARFLGRNAHPAAGEWETTSTVIACDVPRDFAYAVERVEDPSAVWRYVLEPVGPGTRLTQTAQIGPGRSGLSFAIDAMPDKEDRIVARRLEEHLASMEANLGHIKQLAEQAAQPGQVAP
ncbi:MAG: SRPBCC family protein [Micrococcales bacterium]|nr:SRPBCC family protein [Micrococcales bacterium]